MKRTKTWCLVAAIFTASLNAFAAEWAKPVPNDCTLESGQQYYLYNATIEKFVYTQGAQTSLESQGSAITFTQVSGGDWKMECSKGYLFSDIDYVGYNGGSEDENTAWYVEKQSAGTYHIRPSKSDVDFSWELYPDMWMGLSYAKWVLMPVLKSEDGAIEWNILSEAEYANFLSKVNLHHAMTELQESGYDVKDLLAVYNNTASTTADYDAAVESVKNVLFDVRVNNATEENPADVTSKYVRNADLTENWVNDGHDVPGWTMVPAYFCGMGETDSQGFYDDNKTLGSWSGGAFGDNKVYQSLTGLKNGKYKFENYGFWIRHTGEDGDPIKGAYIYAKVGEKLYQAPLADTGWSAGYSEVVFECRTGDAEVGIMFEGTNVGQCIILDFKLEYLGEKPASERLSTLIANAQPLVDGAAICSEYLNKLTADISQAQTLIAGGDVDAQEALFATFEADYEEAVKNKEAYESLEALLQTANETLAQGDSEEMEKLSDYLADNEISEKVEQHLYNNGQIEEIMKTLSELNDKAKNSVIAAGTDVTDLLVNGRFDTTGGWKATLNDFSIDSGKQILERWWSDWSAEQVVENVANGTYRLEVQGFQWCSWDWSASDDDWAQGDGTPTYKVTSKIRLNDGEVTIHNVFACGPTDIQEGYQGSSYYVPDNADVALKFFDLGLYNNVVEATVTDNTLRIEFDCSSNGFWNCFTNLRLYYIGADTEEAFQNLENALARADEVLSKKMDGKIRKALEEAKSVGEAVLKDRNSKFDAINGAATDLLALSDQASVSIKEYALLSITLAQAETTLADSQAAASAAGKELKTFYDATNEDYQSDYPSFDSAAVSTTVKKMEDLIAAAKIGGGFKAGDDITSFIINPSFENTYGNDEAVGGAAHTVPYGWTMLIGDKDCRTAQELTDAGINSWTAIEDNAYTTDGAHSYCLLSAPVPDAYLYQTIKGLPTGTYKVTVDMNVTYDGGCSRLTGQRLLVNNNAQYYGMPEFYNESELDALHPEEVSRTFAGYDEVNTNETGEVGDMGNMSTLTVEVSIQAGEDLVLGVRTDNNKSAMNRNYENNWWDCTGRYKLDNFRLYCVSVDATGIETPAVANSTSGADAYNLMGIKVNPASVRGIYIQNGKKVLVK
ncbi:MAG: hypothetical protein IJ693_06810 [Bacteroidaceae bacterium]|nr:hypothetical protein [Bacteroidaceae bacterium]